MLAPPWQAATDPRSGAVFYFNPQSGQTTWTPPYAQTMGYGQMPMPYAPNPYAPNPYAPNPYAQPYPQPYQQSYQQPVPQNPYAQAAHPYHTAPRPAAAAAPAPAPAPQAEEQPAYMSAPDPETDPEAFEAWQAVQEHLMGGPSMRMTSLRLPSGRGMGKPEGELCPDFLKGKCATGQYCTLSHGAEFQSRAPPPPKAPKEPPPRNHNHQKRKLLQDAQNPDLAPLMLKPAPAPAPFRATAAELAESMMTAMDAPAIEQQSEESRAHDKARDNAPYQVRDGPDSDEDRRRRRRLHDDADRRRATEARRSDEERRPKPAGRIRNGSESD
ncbi:hypothetical protein M885DRAFT_517390 [Pelagophyceae sp. CCMP2097]|nr:hypothetical protein M885DRAFT_517390 [Pelagophyceae sp. CCMP2097]